VHYTLVALLLFQVLLFAFPGLAKAQDYVLPYPSYMPGHRLYRIHQVWEKIQEKWHFGNLAKFKYHLGLSDKYLVEAKTLFEYKQYPLAIRALKIADTHFTKAPIFLMIAQKEGKDISGKTALLSEAAKKHKEILEKLLLVVPPEFNWQPEKREATLIKIKSLLEESIRLRRQVIPGVS
jgi:hypothetical protein